jgi:hypothetical protein
MGDEIIIEGERVCSSCKKIRDGNGSWLSIEHYLKHHTEHEFSHGICPECRLELYLELFKTD